MIAATAAYAAVLVVFVGAGSNFWEKSEMVKRGDGVSRIADQMKSLSTLTKFPNISSDNSLPAWNNSFKIV